MEFVDIEAREAPIGCRDGREEGRIEGMKGGRGRGGRREGLREGRRGGRGRGRRTEGAGE